MKPMLFLISAILIFMHMSSCDTKCQGAPDTIYRNGIQLKVTFDTATSYNQAYSHMVQLLPKTTTEKGYSVGDCRTKSFPTVQPEQLDSSRIVVYCNHDLRHEGKTVAKGENLLHRKDVYQVEVYISDGFFSSGSILIKTDSLQNGFHTFYVSGTTTLGNNFSDSVSIWYK